MAGGITDAWLFSGGTPLDVTGSAGGSLGAFTGLAGFSNPITSGIAIMSALGVGAPTIKKSGADAITGSGFAMFEGENVQAYNKPLMDLSSPAGVLIASALVVASIWAYKKFKG